MSRLILIGCGARKLDHAADARDLYTGPLFRDRRAYAEASRCPWWIVSARYGLVDPTDLVEPYDLRVTDLQPNRRARWALEVVAELVGRLDGPGRLREIVVELHAGADYAELLRDILLAAGLSYLWPVEGLGIGEQRAWYAQQARRHAVGLGVGP